MRIGIACNRFGQSGGMEQYALRVTKALLRLGHTPVIFTMTADETLPFYKQTEVHQWTGAIRWLPNKWNVKRFNQWLLTERKKVPVDFMIACCIAVSAEIATCGGNHIGYLKAMKKSVSFFDRWIINLERTMYRQATLVVAHSEAMKLELEDFYEIDSQKIRVIYPPQCFQTTTEVADRRALREKFGLPQDKTLFLFPSSSHKRKGLDLLRRYFEKTEFPELLVVAGKPLKRPIKNAQYVGFCTDMPTLYQACDYTVMASLYEPLGMVGAESVSCGTPAIMGKNIGCCEILVGRALRNFDVHSLADFERVMAEVRKHPVKLKPPYEQYISHRGVMTGEMHVTEILSEFMKY